MEKSCTKCGVVKLLADFYANPNTTDGFTGKCKVCVLAEKKEGYKPHPRPTCQVVGGKKRCTRCKETKDATRAFFHKTKSSADGFYNECRACRVAVWATTEHKTREVDLEAVRKWRRRIREEMLEAYGRKCECCLETHEQFLTLDHIGGRTEENHPWASKAGTSIYGYIKKLGWPKDLYRLLCMNCNWAIRHGGICPHQSA